jgi:hypothetical protein
LWKDGRDRTRIRTAESFTSLQLECNALDRSATLSHTCQQGREGQNVSGGDDYAGVKSDSQYSRRTRRASLLRLCFESSRKNARSIFTLEPFERLECTILFAWLLNFVCLERRLLRSCFFLVLRAMWSSSICRCSTGDILCIILYISYFTKLSYFYHCLSE